MVKYLVLGALAAVLFLSPLEVRAEAGGAGVSVGSGGNWVFPGGSAGGYWGAAIGAGLIVIGAARGIGRIGGSAVESMARQPEAAKDISGAMLLSAALIEGVSLFGVVVTLLVVVLK